MVKITIYNMTIEKNNAKKKKYFAKRLLKGKNAQKISIKQVIKLQNDIYV